MSVDIGQVVEEGGRRTIARNGLYFVAIVWVLGVLNGLSSNTITQGMLSGLPTQGPMGPPTVGPTLGISPGVAAVLSLVFTLLSVIVSAAAIRTFVTQETETIPRENVTRNLLLMLVKLVVGGIVFSIAVGIGIVLLIIPGIFILVSLFFWNVFVVVEDQNFIEGFQNSWALTSGNRIMLFVLGLVVVIIGAVVAGVVGVVGGLIPGIVGFAVGQIGTAFASVFWVAAAARAFLQLNAEEPAEMAE